jgi:NADPH-dependent glutamate synthase beta subunit-like oxidoreductase/coenzyme F420-reducing hydrogenase delta subunit/NAD-dependent dihydropyrimidine dehydrogenase PreA subunit
LNNEKTNAPAAPEYPPCQAGCPINTDVQEYVRQIAVGNYDSALEVIMKVNPLSAVCGMICAHPCEDECRRKDVDEAVSIRALKRFAVENGRWPEAGKKEPTRPEKVAVVGGGPAGLMVARELVQMGFGVTVFERTAECGGAVANFIPLYRLPMEWLRRDVAQVAGLGVDIKTGVELGKDFSIDDLTKDYSAVVLAMGLPVSRAIPIPGNDAKGVMLALPFLNDAKFNNFKFEPGRQVIVIGGGNVAMDVARTALRCGAEKVKLSCLECREEMPAFEWEIEEAIDEGVEMFPAWGPKQVVLDSDGNITGLELQECLSVFDEQKRFSPKFGEEVQTVEGNTVIFAIGQANDNLSYLKEFGIELTERGILKFSPRTLQTTRPGVFACGELAFGPGSAVKAMSSGRKTALAVQAFLDGVPFDADNAEPFTTFNALSPSTVEKVKNIERLHVPLLDAETRKTHFEHAEIGYDERMALCESRRCLDCAAGAECVEELCAVCLTCLRVCPYGVPRIDENGVFSIRNEECQACGLCVGICPARAIRFRNYYAQASLDRLEEAVKGAQTNGPAAVVFCCSYGAFAEKSFLDYLNNGRPSNLAVVRVPCVAKVEVANLLQALELGAEAVFVAGCEQEEECTYHDVAKWAGQRVSRAREIITELGLAPERVEHLNLTPDEVRNFAPVAESFLAKVKDVTENGGGGESK